MNIKRFIIAAISVFVIIQITDFIFHNIIQSETYEGLKHVWREDMLDKMWLMLVVAVVFSAIFVYIYVRGFVGNDILAGVKYGIIMSFMHPFVASLSQYAIYPLPFSLIIQWYIFGVIQFILCGIAVSSIYKKSSN